MARPPAGRTGAGDGAAPSEEPPSPLPRVALLDATGWLLSIVWAETDSDRREVYRQAHRPRPAAVETVLDLGVAQVVRDALRAGPLLHCHAGHVCVGDGHQRPEGHCGPRQRRPNPRAGRSRTLRARRTPHRNHPLVPGQRVVQGVLRCFPLHPPTATATSGPRRGLDRYEVVEAAGRLLVDLRAWQPGPERVSASRPTRGGRRGGRQRRAGGSRPLLYFPAGPGGTPTVDRSVWTSRDGLRLRLLPDPEKQPEAYDTIPPFGPPADYRMFTDRPGPPPTVDRDAPTTDLRP